MTIIIVHTREVARRIKLVNLCKLRTVPSSGYHLYRCQLLFITIYSNPISKRENFIVPPSVFWRCKWHCNDLHSLATLWLKGCLKTQNHQRKGGWSGKKAPNETGVVGEARQGRPQGPWFGVSVRRAMGSHWRALSRGVTGLDLHPENSAQLQICSRARPSGLWGFSTSHSRLTV